MSDLPREGTLERIARFADLEDGWEDGHRGITSEVADAAREVTERIGPSLVFAAPFDGAIVLTRLWHRHVRPYGREVQIRLDGLMDLVADHPYEQGSDADYDQGFDLDKAAAWLSADTRTSRATAS